MEGAVTEDGKERTLTNDARSSKRQNRSSELLSSSSERWILLRSYLGSQSKFEGNNLLLCKLSARGFV
jgi:hypothetical protein